MIKKLNEYRETGLDCRHFFAVMNGVRRVLHQLIIRENDLRRLLHGICQNLKDAFGYPQVSIALFEDGGGEAIKALFGAGFEETHGEDKITLPKGLLSACLQRFSAGERVAVFRDAALACGEKFLGFRQGSEYGALCAPLMWQGNRLGILFVSIQKEHIDHPRALSLFQELSEDIAFGVHHISVQEKRRLQAQILNESRDLVTVADLEGRIVYVSRGNQEILRRSELELLGQTTDILGEDPSRGPTQRQIIEKTLRDGEWNGEVINYAADGKEIILDCRTWLVRDDQGNPSFLAGVAHDITERKGMERALSESRREMKTLLDNLPGMSYRCRNNAEWEMLFVSDGCLPLTGYPPQDLLEGNPTYGRVIHPDDRVRVWKTIQEMVAQERAFQMEYRILRKDGEERWVWEQGRLVSEGDAREKNLEGLILDVTERHRAEMTLRESEARSRRVQRVAQVGSWEFDLEKGKVVASEQARHIYGLEEKEWSIAEVQKIPLLEYRGLLDRALKDLIEKGQPYAVDFKIRRPTDGAIIDIRSLAEYDPKRRLVLGAMQDVSSHKEAETKLSQTSSALEALYRASPLPMLGLDQEGRITHWNQAAEELFAWREEEALGRSLPIIPEAKREEADRIQKRLFAGESISGFELTSMRRDGTPFQSLLFASPIWDFDNQITGAIYIFMDITEQKKLQRRMAFLAFHDALTGLSNRAHLKERFNQEITRVNRNKSRIALCLIDLDRFKLVNDTFGHPSGDELLCQVALRLRGFVRGTDLVCRLGGDEFLIMMNDVRDMDGLTAAVRKIQSLFGEPFILEGSSFKVTVSIGISVYPDDGSNIHQLFKNADNAMYHAKEQGCDNFQFYREEMDSKVRERMFLENGLRQALDNAELCLHYQPQIELTRGKVTGAEALLRWRHPKMGMISPDRFIPVAEDTGIIHPLGQWVIEESCRQVCKWRDSAAEPFTLSVNISTVQLFDDHFLEFVAAVMKRYRVGEGRLAFELTESVFMKDQKLFHERILNLKSLGIEIHLDDFGTGYSSLSYLKMFEIDRLKIDQSFVRDIVQDPNDLTLVATMIQMAHNLGLRVIAEGVENQAQLDLLMGHGCDQFQGFLCSEALPAEEFERHFGKGGDWVGFSVSERSV